MRSIFREDYDPLKPADGSGNAPGFWEGVAYETPGTTLTSLSMEGQAYEDVRERLMANGMDEQEASDHAEGLAPLIALPQLALEKVGFNLWAKKVPGFSAVMDGIGQRVTNRLARVAVKTVATGVAETVVETGQTATGYLVQEAAAALEKDMPGIQWRGEGGALDGMWTQAPRVFVTMLPLSLLGAARGLDPQTRADQFKNTTTRQKQILGFTEEGIAAIENANGTDEISSAIDAAWENRDPNGEEAKAAVAAEAAELEALNQAAQDSQLRGDLPTIVLDHNGRKIVRDGGTGEDIGQADAWEDIQRIVNTHVNISEEAKATAGELQSMKEKAADQPPTEDTGLLSLVPDQGSSLDGSEHGQHEAFAGRAITGTDTSLPEEVMDYVRNTGPLGGRLATAEQLNAVQRELAGLSWKYTKILGNWNIQMNSKIRDSNRPTSVGVFCSSSDGGGPA